jgi:hypothetical protein
MKSTREEAKKYLCGGCEGVRTSGSYFNNACKGEAKDCGRINDYLVGWDVAVADLTKTDEELVDVLTKIELLSISHCDAKQYLTRESARAILSKVLSSYQTRVEVSFSKGVHHGTTIRNEKWNTENHKRHGEKMRKAIAEAVKAERERIAGELEDIRCSAAGEYLPGIERLMLSLRGESNEM